MDTLNIIIYILLSIIIITWVIFWIKTKSILGIFGINNSINQIITPSPSTTYPLSTTTQSPTTTSGPTCISCINGTCLNGQCICSTGYTGWNCYNQILCPNNCNSNGNCVLGSCVCNSGWTGNDCSVKNANWFGNLYTTNSTCGGVENTSCTAGNCCINGTCISCQSDTIIQNQGKFDGQKPSCAIVNNNFCPGGEVCRYNGACTTSSFYAICIDYTTNSSYILISKDGIGWDKKNIVVPAFLNGISNARKLFYNGKIWVLISERQQYLKNSPQTLVSQIIYSTDLTNWNVATGTPLYSSQSITFNINLNIWLICCGFEIIYSNDGKTWNNTNYSALFSYINNISCNKNFCVAVGISFNNGSEDNTIAWSSDGINWTPLSNIFTNVGSVVLWNETQQLWVAFGKNYSTYNTISAWSIDGINWNSSVFVTDTNAYTDAICCNGSIWVVGGTGKKKLCYSTDGKIWTESPSIISGMINSIEYNGTIWIAVGTGFNSNGDCIATSSDGINWVISPNTGNYYKNSLISDVKWYNITDPMYPPTIQEPTTQQPTVQTFYDSTTQYCSTSDCNPRTATDPDGITYTLYTINKSGILRNLNFSAIGDSNNPTVSSITIYIKSSDSQTQRLSINQPYSDSFNLANYKPSNVNVQSGDIVTLLVQGLYGATITTLTNVTLQLTIQ